MNPGLIVIAALAAACGPPPLDHSGSTAEWPEYGGNAEGERFSPLTQITPANVRHLDVAWIYHTGDVSDGRGEVRSTTAFEATPIVVDGTMYVCTPFNRVIALDPETGNERWVFDPEIDLTSGYANQLVCRGLTTWKDPDPAAVTCSRRILTATNDGRLIALDAATGERCPDFADGSDVDLTVGIGETLWQGEYQVTSPPAVAGELVIVGSAVADNTRTDAPTGAIRAYDVRTGVLAWAWDLAPPFDIPDAPRAADTGYMLATPNVWAPFARPATRCPTTTGVTGRESTTTGARSSPSEHRRVKCCGTSRQYTTTCGISMCRRSPRSPTWRGTANAFRR
jgi:quinoprotein glucose dehydrogenase